ncbi:MULTISPECIES: radical SAM protein [Spirulina sp. CCY15215]|uniref:B12-binding domain-containing radical SAM protein n=1 Tax=Spirulina sp. CCY15215 TaxID=2767591 RepID=UPI00194F924E
MSHITLVRPPALISRHSNTGPLTPPIGLAYIAASLIEAGHSVTIVDGIGEDPLKITPLFDDRMLAIGLLMHEIVERVPQHTDLIGVSCMFSQEWPYIRKLIELLKIKSPQVPLLAGGEHITAMPDFVLEECPDLEYCALGEGEETLVDIAKRLDDPTTMTEVEGLALRREGRILRTPPRARITAIDDIPQPAWDLVPLENYLSNGLGYGVDLGRSMPLIATRGCPFRCTFCSNPSMWTTKWIARKPELVLDEIEEYIKKYQVDNIDFYDLTAIVRKDWIVEFCQLIKQRNLKFTWQLPSGTRSEAIDAEVSQLLYEAGCRNLSYAPESGSMETLKKIKKMVKLDRMLDSMKAAVKNGLNVKAHVIIGFPRETRRQVWETLGFLVKMAWIGVHDMSITMFSPYPGSELFQELTEDKKITEYSDDYFLGLACYSDPTQTVSWCSNLSTKELNLMWLLGTLIFYSTQYTLRPWRLIRMLFNLISQRQESRLDKSLQEYIRRVFVTRKSLAAK